MVTVWPPHISRYEKAFDRTVARYSKLVDKQIPLGRVRSPQRKGAPENLSVSLGDISDFTKELNDSSEVTRELNSAPSLGTSEEKTLVHAAGIRSQVPKVSVLPTILGEQNKSVGVSGESVALVTVVSSFTKASVAESKSTMKQTFRIVSEKENALKKKNDDTKSTSTGRKSYFNAIKNSSASIASSKRSWKSKQSQRGNKRRGLSKLLLFRASPTSSSRKSTLLKEKADSKGNTKKSQQETSRKLVSFAPIFQNKDEEDDGITEQSMAGYEVDKETQQSVCYSSILPLCLYLSDHSCDTSDNAENDVDAEKNGRSKRLSLFRGGRQNKSLPGEREQGSVQQSTENGGNWLLYILPSDDSESVVPVTDDQCDKHISSVAMEEDMSYEMDNLGLCGQSDDFESCSGTYASSGFETAASGEGGSIGTWSRSHSEAYSYGYPLCKNAGKKVF